MKKILSLLIFVILCSCSESSSNLPQKNSIQFTESGDAGLIIVVETKFLQSAYTEIMFQVYKEEVLEILSDMLGVEKSKMENMTLSEIIEEFGEEWQIEEIKKTADKYYKEVVVLTDSSATGNNFLDNIKQLSDKGLYIDVIFSLHGSEHSVAFSEQSWLISNITNFIKDNGYHVRALYQTCCYGYYHFDEWETAGICAINGSKGANGINIFSPVYFIEEWTSGKAFNDAVKSAFDREIEKLKTYNDILPIEEFFLGEQTLNDSKQYTGGLYNSLLWNKFPEDYKNKGTGPIVQAGSERFNQ